MTRGIRIKAMEALNPDKSLTSSQVAELLGITKQQAIDNLGAAIKDGYVVNEMGEDEHGKKARIYVLTPKGRHRVVTGRISINGKLADENAAACDAEENEPPPADSVLLAMANKMLTERLAGVAHVLRGCGLPALAAIDDGEDLQIHASALAGAYQMALAKMDDALRAEANAPSGYAVMATDGVCIHKNFESAKRGAVSQLNNGEKSVHVVAIMATAKSDVSWS